MKKYGNKIVYDERYWEITRKSDHLYNVKYIGEIIDGRIIGRIPPNVNQLNETFKDCVDLVYPPEIPPSVRIMYKTFAGCISLVKPPSLPPALQMLNYAFMGCVHLQNFPVFPTRLEEFTAAFLGCKEAEGAVRLPKIATVLNYAFSGCEKLTGIEQFPADICFAWKAFENCINLEEIEGGISSLVYSSCINNNYRENLFDGCEKLFAKYGVRDSDALYYKLRLPAVGRSFLRYPTVEPLLNHGDEIFNDETGSDFAMLVSHVCGINDYSVVVQHHNRVFNARTQEWNSCSESLDSDYLKILIMSDNPVFWLDEKKIVALNNELCSILEQGILQIEVVSERELAIVKKSEHIPFADNTISASGAKKVDAFL